MEIHNQLDYRYQEVVHQGSLVIDFGLQGISFAPELEVDLTYKEN